jgi:hypothetical protein
MKPLTLGLVFLVTFAFSDVLAQTTTYGNFKLEDQQLIYQKIFLQDSITLAKIGDYFTKQDFASNVNAGESQVEFDVTDMVVDYKKFGFSQVATPPVMQTGKFSGHVTISAKEGKYRVTMRDIMFTGDLGYKKISAKDKLTAYACRDNGTYISPDWTKPNTLGLLDKAFTDKLQYTEPKGKKEGSDW